MSSDSLALLRRNLGSHYGQLAEEHYQHDLQPSDRAALQSAASKISTHTAIGSAVGLGLGLFLAFRLRANRKAMFDAFRAAEKPTHLQFAGGRVEPIPDLTPLLRPSTLGDIAAYTFFAGGGLFFGGELGLLSGTGAARRTITRDPEATARIEAAWRRVRAEVLREEAGRREGGEGGFGADGRGGTGEGRGFGELI